MLTKLPFLYIDISCDSSESSTLTDDKSITLTKNSKGSSSISMTGNNSNSQAAAGGTGVGGNETDKAMGGYKNKILILADRGTAKILKGRDQP